MTGGHHEANRRAGTENVPAIVGFGKALDLAHERLDEDMPRIAAMRDHLQQRLLATVPNIYVSAREAVRNPNTLHVLFHFIEGEGLLLKLMLQHGIAVSTGSACTSGTLEPSHVLAAMGISKQLANSGVRISLGRENTMEQMDLTAVALAEAVASLRAMSPLQDAYARGTLRAEDLADYQAWMTPGV